MTIKTPEAHLYLCSSVRHIYLAIGFALAHPGVEHHLVLISQRKGRLNILADCLSRDSSLFTSFHIEYDGDGKWGKYQQARRCLQKIKQIALALNPSHVFVGNDRKVEFQYTMHSLRENGKTATGVYLDDGTGSYLSGRYMKMWGAFTDQYIDRPVKKLVFGSWCDRVRCLGGTRWVDQCYLNFPNLAPLEIRTKKQVKQLPADWYTSKAFNTYIKGLLGDKLQTGDGETVESGYDALLILPAAKAVEKIFGSVTDYNSLINRYLIGFSSVAIKYHPRETHFYFSSSKDVTVLPSSIPAEILFSLVAPKRVIGDLSSALLSAVWLYPDIHTRCLWPAKIKKPALFEIIRNTHIEIEEIN